MIKQLSSEVTLGFEVGTGQPVTVPIAHMFVCGQTQQSGKTTALQAIVARSGRKALAFVTKRGETLHGRSIRPYLPREGDQPIHWRVVETLLAGAVEQKGLRSERFWVIKAAKGARTLEDVQANVRRELAKAKNSKNEEVYTLLDEYLELVLPQMRSLNASDVLDLAPGLNVMDLSAIGSQSQGMVIRAALERINHHETHVLTVLPEAWEFAPRDRSAPAKGEAEAMVRKGAAPTIQNFLLCDSQDIAGVSPVVRQGSSVWLFGVQRELNELARAIRMMPAGVKRPKADDVATLGLGEFFVCWKTHAVKTYVRPAWMTEDDARAVARRFKDARDIIPPAIVPDLVRPTLRSEPRPLKEIAVTEAEAQQLRTENSQLKTELADLRREFDALKERHVHDQTGTKVGDRRQDPPVQPRAQRANSDAPAGSANQRSQPAGDRVVGFQAGAELPKNFDSEALYQAFKARLIEELPGDARVMQIVTSRPELHMLVKRETIQVNVAELAGRCAFLLSKGWFDEPKKGTTTSTELAKRGWTHDHRNVSKVLDRFAEQGFLRVESDGYQAVAGMKVNIIEAA